jgi:hypothetical protein
MECGPVFTSPPPAVVTANSSASRNEKKKKKKHSLTCVSPPPHLDLTKDKAAIFEWIVKGLLRAVTPGDEAAGLPVVAGAEGLRFMMWCNDHTFVVGPNFLRFIKEELGGDHRRVVYAGKELKSGGREFNSGAAGIILSQASMESLVSMWNQPDDFPECFPPDKQPKTARPRHKVEGNDSFGKVKEPGLLLADCLHLGGILPNRTRDDHGSHDPAAVGSLNSTEDYFHAYGPQRLVAGTYDDWFVVPICQVSRASRLLVTFSSNVTPVCTYFPRTPSSFSGTEIITPPNSLEDAPGN